MYVYRCEDTLESVFTAIYEVYENRHARDRVELAMDWEPRLFAEEIIIQPKPDKYEKVIRTLRRRFGESDFRGICLALSTPDEEKAQAVYRTVERGLALECREGHLFDNLADNHVNKAFKLMRNADREYCHLRGFARFEEMESGLMYSRMEPRNNVLSFLMPHFADRFPEEDFVLHDVGRQLYGIHRRESEVGADEMSWCFFVGEENFIKEMKNSADECEYQMLFKYFCHKIAIPERRNYELQRSLMPLHFREYMTEFR